MGNAQDSPAPMAVNLRDFLGSFGDRIGSRARLRDDRQTSRDHRLIVYQ